MVTYFIVYEFGCHHLPLQVPERSFNNLVYDMSNEFEIHKDESDGRLSVWIYNYWGDKQEIAYALTSDGWSPCNSCKRKSCYGCKYNPPAPFDEEVYIIDDADCLSVPKTEI